MTDKEAAAWKENVECSISSSFLKMEVVLDLLIAAGLTTQDDFRKRIVDKGTLLRAISRDEMQRKELGGSVIIFGEEEPS